MGDHPNYFQEQINIIFIGESRMSDLRNITNFTERNLGKF